MSVSLDHVHIFASDAATTVRFFETLLGAAVVWDETVAGARVIRLKIGRGFVFRNPIREEPTFKYVMIAGPDDLLIELFECHEPARWDIARGGLRSLK